MDYLTLKSIPLVPDNETGGFSVVWTIQNFSYCLQKECLGSPKFKLSMSDTNHVWYLVISPKGVDGGNDVYFGVFLYVISRAQLPINVNLYFSIRSTNGTFKGKNGVILSSSKKVQGWGSLLLNINELFNKGGDAFLENDTLTLRCRIWGKYPDPVVSGQCYARTVIDVRRIEFPWILEKFKELLHNGKRTITFHPTFSNKQSFTVDIFLSGEIHSEKKIQVEIKQNAPYQECFMTCKFSLLDADRKAFRSVHDDHRFEASNEPPNWLFTFMPVDKILEHGKLYLVNGALSLRSEFAVSYGEKYGYIEKTQYGVTQDDDKPCCRNTVDTGFPGSSKDNLQQVFRRGRFSDLTIRTASSKEFPVHKAILCERSEVFNAMFEHDTKENRTGVVEIEDMNDDAVSKMLLFIYTDILEDLEWEVASELYLAADKYGIMALKRECATFLKGNLNCSNVCEVLGLADMHQDQDMKMAAQYFVMDHATEIISSEYWKKFVQEKSFLAAETLQVLFMRNLKM